MGQPSCALCEATFVATTPNRRYCSRKCGRTAARLQARTLHAQQKRWTCHYCAEPFASQFDGKPDHPNAPKYCTAQCHADALATPPSSRVHYVECQCGAVAARRYRSWKWTCAMCAAIPKPRRSSTCLECSMPFTTRVPHQRFCGRRCLGRSVQRNAAHRRRSRKSGGEIIYRRRVYDRDRQRCHICGEHIDWSLKSPDPAGFTIDHVVPLSRGGTHTYANVASAHRSCNSAKGAHPLPQDEQLRLLG